MKRNLIYWTRHTWETARMALVIVAVVSLFTIINANGIQWSLFFSTVPYFLLFAAVFCIILVNSSTQTLYTPLLLSMGETRRNVFFGYCYFRVLIIGATAALCCLIWALAPDTVSSTGLNSLGSILSILVLSSALGSIFGTLHARWKWVGMIIIGLVGGVAGGVGGMLISSGIDLERSSVEKLARFVQELPWWLALIAALLLAADLTFHALLLRRQEVKL